MPSKIIWNEDAKKELLKLEKPVIERALKKISEMEGSDGMALEKVKGTRFYKIRIGHYRLILEKFPTNNILSIHKIGHRKNVYKQPRY
ncbi:MAG: type II toxin-antitoxin system RelE/ParE family toxin [Candidatus Diapherotrites archaeon]|nr:type II toxin-antitoxin system RelE/ParE family toxin [Candidatus Diapherotrites archaeon]